MLWEVHGTLCNCRLVQDVLEAGVVLIFQHTVCVTHVSLNIASCSVSRVPFCRLIQDMLESGCFNHTFMLVTSPTLLHALQL